MIGDELRQARETAGLTQEKLVHKAGIDRSYLSDLENNKKCPTLDMLFQICDALGVKASDLVAHIEQHDERFKS